VFGWALAPECRSRREEAKRGGPREEEGAAAFITRPQGGGGGLRFGVRRAPCGAVPVSDGGTLREEEEGAADFRGPGRRRGLRNRITCRRRPLGPRG
jgi:hypothetical protein